ncbi:MAG TPA: CHASE domain-containing protein [Polyangiales bacterium]|nr:CHASE domain-containing protein [Polyangiales bacterium]
MIAVGLLVTAALAVLRASANLRFARTEFSAAAERVAAALSERVRLYEYGLRGTRGAIVAAGSTLSHRSFETYARSRDIQREFPGARGFGFIRRVPQADVDGFLQRARLDDAPEFSLRVLSAREGERYIIQYIEPADGNLQAFGLDIASEPLRRAAADAAAESGEAALTGPITLVQAEHKPRSSFLFLLPIYKSDAPRDTYEERRAALHGWAYAPLVTEDVLSDLNLAENGLRVTLFDISDNVRPQSFFNSGDVHEPPAQGLAKRMDRPMFGRTWRIDVSALPSFISGLHLFGSGSVFALGMVLSLLSAALAYVFVQERERAEQLTLQRVELAAIIETASDAIVSVAANGNIVSWNDAAVQLFGYSAQEAIGQQVEACCQLSETSSSYGDLLAGLAEVGAVPPPFDASCRRRDGSWIDVSIAIAPLGSRGGQGGMALTYRDIQERSARERGLRQLSSSLEKEVRDRTASLEAARRDLQNILDALPSMIGYWQADLRNGFANHAYLDWFGFEPEALRGMHMRELLGERVFELNRPYIEAVLRGEPQEFERIYPGTDGRRERHSLTNYVPDIVDRQVRGFYAVVHDVTELNRSRENLAAAARENEGLLRTLDHLAVVFVAQPDGSLSYVNEQLCKRSGFPAHALIGRNQRMLSADVHTEAFWTEMSETLGGGIPWRGELCNAAKDGSHYWLDAVIAPFYNSDGQLLKYVCMGVDITAAKASSAELSRAKVAAEAANAAKTEFVTNMSHEIRTPLNAIIGMTYLLERTALATEQKQQVRTIQGAGRVLLDLLTDVLDLAKIEAGSLSLDAMSFEPRNLVIDLESMFGPQAQAAKLELSVEIADDVPEVVRGDSTRSRQILINLVGNAVKFTERGKVTLAVSRASDDPIRLRFDVRDTGPGISAETQARLFVPFTQADGSTSRRYGGSGLGLSIVKRLVESMGGEFGVKSELGKGSDFWVILPYATGRLSSAQPPSAVSVPPATLADASALEGLKLLVTDDSDINRDVAKRILEHVGAKVTTCADGMSTLEELRRTPRAWDAILMDVQMPQMDGNETTRRIRSELDLQELVIIGLTAGALRAERQRSLAAGMNDFLTKPIEPATLIRCIRKHVPDARLPAPPRMPAKQDILPAQLALRAWPSVNGLDVREIARDLNYDAGEYAVMLSRLMRDGAEIAATDNGALDEPEARTQLAARVHKLRGSAGVLGAKALFSHASQLDDALKRDQAKTVTLPLLQSMRVCYSELSAAVAPWIQRVQATAGPPPVAEAPGELQLLTLIELLQNNDLAALRLVSELTPGLRTALGEQRFQTFQSAVSALNFTQAAELVEQLRAA